MEENNRALEELVNEVAEASKALELKEQELSARNTEVAELLRAQKVQEKAVSALKDMIKEEMEKENCYEWENDSAKLTLSPSGKFRVAKDSDIENVADEVCDIKKVLNNKKVKAYYELNKAMPDGVESTGNVLRIKFK